MELTRITEDELEIVLFRHDQRTKGTGEGIRADFTNATWTDGTKRT